MNLPLTREDFLDVFARYNRAVWPAPWLLTALALLAVVAITQKWRVRHRLVGGVLALLWLWAGFVFHLLFFADVNQAAIGFGLGFIVQAVALVRHGMGRHALAFDAPATGARTVVGALVIAYAILIYPLLAAVLGQHWPRVPTFGAPCQVVLFTFGLFFWTGLTLPRSLLIVPLAWAVIATGAVFEFGMLEDGALLVVGALAAVWLLPFRRPRHVEHARLHHPPALVHRIWKRGKQLRPPSA